MSKNKHLPPIEDESDSTFAFIAGYTPGGFPYGTTWEELGIDPGLSLEEKVDRYKKGAYNMIQMHKPLTPSQEEKLDQLQMRLCQIQEEIEDLANETGNEDIINASLSVLDALFCLGNADAKHPGESCVQGEDPADDTVADDTVADDTAIEVDDSELPF